MQFAVQAQSEAAVLGGVADEDVMSNICAHLEERPNIVMPVLVYCKQLMGNATGGGGGGCGGGVGGGKKTAEEVLAGVYTPASAGMLTVDAAQNRFVGAVKSFNQAQGYGFISSQELQQNFGCDVFVHKNQFGAELMMAGAVPVGTWVTFTIQMSKKGQPQAFDLAPFESGGQWGGIAGLQASAGQWNGGAKRPFEFGTAGFPMKRPRFEESMKEPLGQFEGVIKSFSEKNGFGFIMCPGTQELGYANDVFLHHQQKGTFAPGDNVMFTAFLNGKGQPQAKDLLSLDASIL